MTTTPTTLIGKKENIMPKHIYVVAAVIKDNDNEKILCVQRGPNNLLPLKWEFPGGKIETG